MATGGREPVRFHNVPNNVGDLLETARFFQQASDDRTQIPRYIHGDEKVGGAMQTASGMNMMLNSAGRGIKRVLRIIDKEVIIPVMEALYRFNLVHHPDDEVKGDARIIYNSATSSVAREATKLRRQEFLQMTGANPIDMEIIQKEGRRRLLEAISREDLEIPGLIPTREEMEERDRRQQQEMAMMQQEQGQDMPPQEGPIQG